MNDIIKYWFDDDPFNLQEDTSIDWCNNHKEKLIDEDRDYKYFHCENCWKTRNKEKNLLNINNY